MWAQNTGMNASSRACGFCAWVVNMASRSAGKVGDLFEEAICSDRVTFGGQNRSFGLRYK
jgi:hypothetical protein